MTDKYLIDKGFKQFHPTQFDSDGVETCFQKRYRDNKGTRYFITINKWKPMTHPHTGEVWGPAYEYHVQLYQKEKHSAIDILFHSEWELEDVEKYLKKLFDSGMFDYYEEDID
jgi:hypothetical protein